MHVYIPGYMSDWTSIGSCVCLSDRLSVDDLAAVQRNLFAVRTEWYNLGLELGQKVSTLDSISARYSGKPNECFRQVLKEWLQGIDPPPTWQAMVNALKSPTIAQHQVAEQIQTEMSPQSPSASASAQLHPKLLGLYDYFIQLHLVRVTATEFLTTQILRIGFSQTELHV